MSKTYWHFAAMKNGEPVMRDGTPIEIGKRYTVPDATMCERGFHGSPTPFDALRYAPGPWVSKREILVVDTQYDKVVGSECVHVVGADATEVLWEFASKYFDIRYPPQWSAVWEVARSAAWFAERSAARGVTSSMAKTAVWTPAWIVAWARAWDSVRAAARDKQNRRLARMLNALLRNE